MKVAKLVLIDQDENYLMLYRSKHPTFGDDADIPGGIVEAGETPREGVIREVFEEIGVTITDVEEIYTGTAFSLHGTQKSLFVAHINTQPEITLSWEHKSYEWMTKAAFLQTAASAKDYYMHMVAAVLK